MSNTKTYSKLRLFTLTGLFLMLLFGPLFQPPTLAKPPEGKFLVIGTGPAGPEHATLKAIESIKKADLLICSDSIEKRFAEYLQDKKIMSTRPWKDMFSYKGHSWRKLRQSDPELIKEFHQNRIAKRECLIGQIKEKMREGKTVALLNSGDPCLFGPCHWFVEGFDPTNVEIIPGVGAFSAAMAALKKSSIPAYDARFVMQTAPEFLFGPSPASKKQTESAVLTGISQYPGTLAFYMALPEIRSLVQQLKAHYPDTLPIAIVYYAGFPEKEKVVKTNLSDIMQKIKNMDENWLGMVIVGRCLEGKPYQTRLEQMPRK
ncbi:MAG: SAM-dependent methyltransferase [Desulfosalsimonadaceae bacterium]